MDEREMKGLQIAKTSRIRKDENGWIVPSQSGRGAYHVKFDGHEPTCTCPDCETRKTKCKHIWAVEYFVKQEIDSEGNKTITKAVRVTYAQDWHNYNQAQCNEQILFTKLLSEVCKNVEQPTYKFGRPSAPLSDIVFASALKVYSTFSLRRFMSLMSMAHEKKYIDKTFSYVTVSNYMRSQELTKVLHKLIELTSLPLASVENDFAVDSSGFSTSRFKRWYDFKYGRETKEKIWIKAHITCGTKTNIVTAVKLSESAGQDTSFFRELIEQTAENFEINEVSADKAYSTRDNMNCVHEVGGIAYIPFKKNAKAWSRGSPVWSKMYYFFMYNHEEFLEHYHKRSNAETVFHMVKAKFRDNVRSKDETAQINEILLKILCHNICVVIQEMHELGIEPDFLRTSGST